MKQPPVKRTDVLCVPEIFRSPALASKEKGTMPDETSLDAKPLPTEVVPRDTEPAAPTACSNHSEKTAIVGSHTDEEKPTSQAVDDGASSTTYNLASDADLPSETAPLQATPSIPPVPCNYAPPSEVSDNTYMPDNPPSPLDEVRGSEGRKPWYVVAISKRPGIYASL